MRQYQHHSFTSVFGFSYHPGLRKQQVNVININIGHIRSFWRNKMPSFSNQEGHATCVIIRGC